MKPDINCVNFIKRQVNIITASKTYNRVSQVTQLHLTSPLERPGEA